MQTDLHSDDPTTAALLEAVTGEFRLLGEIGRGGMGVVYRAIDERLERPVAIKTLPPHLAADPTVRARFLREARTAAALSHPHIVPIYQAVERDRVVYFVMALVEGESLAERIARQGRLDTASLLPFVREIAHALDYAHGAGVVHRDIKAENVLIDRQDRAMLTDFGIARVTEAKPMTATGTVLGTVQYMSPEQIHGETLDGRSDLYALGVLMFLALSGHFPFERGTAPAVLVAHVNSPVPRLRSLVPDVPLPMEDIVAKLMAKSPDDRLASARDLLSALAFVSATSAVARRAVDGAPAAHLPAPVPAPASPPVRMAADDAQQVWARAAELQANTGAVAPPSAFSPPAPLVTRGFAEDEVRAAAVDAGIGARYVERALVEREAMALSVQRGEKMLAAPNPLLGAHTKLEVSAVVERELRPEEFEEIADEIRLALGLVVNVSAVGRTLTVGTVATSTQGGMPRYLQVTVSGRNGRSQIRAFEDITQTAGGLFGGLTGGVGLGAGTALAVITAKFTHSPPEVILTILATLGSAYALARYLFTRSARRTTAELVSVVRRIAARINELP
jgi:serine/threonine-protein kinase